MIYLYLKETPIGLKYLGKTEKNPFKYNGSGLYWKSHLKKHNIKSKDIKTTILFESNNSMLFKETALYYSKLYDIVNSKDFANITEEKGQGGITFTKESHPNHPAFTFKERMTDFWKDENNRKRISLSHTGRNLSDETKQKLKVAHMGKKHSDEHNKKKGRSGELNVSKRDDVRLKISEKLKGHKLSEETKRKISETLKLKKLQKI
jgi:hypothetical protein